MVNIDFIFDGLQNYLVNKFLDIFLKSYLDYVSFDEYL